MAHPVPARRIARWLLPSAFGLVLLFLLPEPIWPIAFLPALAGMVRSSRKDDLYRPLKFGFVLACMSPILILSGIALLFYVVAGRGGRQPPAGGGRPVHILGWTLSAYNLWRHSLRPRDAG